MGASVCNQPPKLSEALPCTEIVFGLLNGYWFCVLYHRILLLKCWEKWWVSIALSFSVDTTALLILSASDQMIVMSKKKKKKGTGSHSVKTQGHRPWFTKSVCVCVWQEKMN